MSGKERRRRIPFTGAQLADLTSIREKALTRGSEDITPDAVPIIDDVTDLEDILLLTKDARAAYREKYDFDAPSSYKAGELLTVRTFELLAKNGVDSFIDEFKAWGKKTYPSNNILINSASIGCAIVAQAFMKKVGEDRFFERMKGNRSVWNEGFSKVDVVGDDLNLFLERGRKGATFPPTQNKLSDFVQFYSVTAMSDAHAGVVRLGAIATFKAVDHAWNLPGATR
ncbi:MAG: hypothetical protein ACM3IJ_02640 [Candidatus Levyibacteriota bacterium]